MKKHKKLETKDGIVKTSRVNTNEDLFKRLLISSDPFITSLRKSIKLLKKTLSNAFLEHTTLKNLLVLLMANMIVSICKYR